MLNKSLLMIMVASATIGVVALVLSAGDAEARDEYRFQLKNDDIVDAGTRCGTSGAWTNVPAGGQYNFTCSGTTAQWKMPNEEPPVASGSVTWDCEDSETHRITLYPTGPMGIETESTNTCAA